MFLASLLLVTLECSKTPPHPHPLTHTVICFNPFMSMFLLFWEAQGNNSVFFVCVCVTRRPKGEGFRRESETTGRRDDTHIQYVWVWVCMRERENSVKPTRLSFLKTGMWLSLAFSWLPWWLRWWRICLQYGRPAFSPWVGRIHWRRAWHASS